MQHTDKNESIAIIGAGPGGLSAAERLKEKGYKNVVIFEKKDRVGGMSLSKVYEAENGKKIVYDMGSIQPMGGKEIRQLARKYGLSWGRGISINKTKLMRFYDFESREYTADFTRYILGYPISKLPGILMDMLRIGKHLFKYRRLYHPGFSGLKHYAELSQPMDNWIDSIGMKTIKNEIKFSVCATGTGTNLALGEKEPSIYFPKLLLELLHMPLRYIDGSYKPIREGYQSLWKEVAKNHDVRLQSKIKHIERGEEKIVIHMENGSKEEFDRLILAFSLDLAKDLLDFSRNEKYIASYIIYAPIWRMAFIAEGLPKDSATLFPESYYSDATTRMPIGIMIPEGDIDERYTLYSCTFQPLDNQVEEEYLQQTANKLTEHFGGKIVKWIDRQFWPHYHGMISKEGVRNGVFEAFNNIQGTQRTYYVGEVLTDSGHAEVMRYSYALIDKFWR